MQTKRRFYTFLAVHLLHPAAEIEERLKHLVLVANYTEVFFLCKKQLVKKYFQQRML